MAVSFFSSWGVLFGEPVYHLTFVLVPDAMDWLEKNQDTDLEELLAEDEAGPKVAKVEGDALAMSLVCNDCGKKFRSQREAEFHANKS
jgi:hypothetical protein